MLWSVSWERVVPEFCSEISESGDGLSYLFREIGSQYKTILILRQRRYQGRAWEREMPRGTVGWSTSINANWRMLIFALNLALSWIYFSQWKTDILFNIFCWMDISIQIHLFSSEETLSHSSLAEWKQLKIPSVQHLFPVTHLLVQPVSSSSKYGGCKPTDSLYEKHHLSTQNVMRLCFQN